MSDMPNAREEAPGELERILASRAFQGAGRSGSLLRFLLQRTLAGQAEEPNSLLTLTRDLLRIRREHPVLHRGDFERFGPTPDGVFAFRRIGPNGRLNVVLNLTAEPCSVSGAGPGRVLIGTRRDRDGAILGADVELGPNEAVVVEESGPAPTRHDSTFPSSDG